MTPRGRILVVEDEAYVRESLATLLERRGFEVRVTASAEQVEAEGAEQGVDAVLADLRLPGMSGLDLVRALAERTPGLPVIVLTAHGSIESAVECMRAGAVDYLRKPVDPEELELTVDRALAERRLRREVRYLRQRDDAEPIGESAAWREILRLIDLAAPADTPVLITGETGVGKEVVARRIHRASPRGRAPFVTVNCAAVPLDLFESEFFGHRKGAFTGATGDRDGRFQVAHGGTLFLDEVNSLAPQSQAKVLRVLQDGTFERVGESRPTRTDVRVVSACNVDLAGEVREERFRSDLFYRINVVAIHVPPLRDRKEDILPLAESFLRELAARHGRPPAGFAAAARDWLLAYEWPGNVRELRNVIERALLLGGGDEITPGDLQPLSTVPPAPRLGAYSDLALRKTLLRTERELLREALERSDGVKRRAAELLEIDERNLAYYLRKHGLS